MKVERLKDVRKSRGLTQKEFGRRVGINQQSRVSSIERGLHVSPELARRFADVLMCDVSELRTPDQPTITLRLSDLSPDQIAVLTKR